MADNVHDEFQRRRKHRQGMGGRGMRKCRGKIRETARNSGRNSSTVFACFSGEFPRVAMTFRRTREGWLRCFATLCFVLRKTSRGTFLTVFSGATIPTRDDVVTRQGIRSPVETHGGSVVSRLEISDEFGTV